MTASARDLASHARRVLVPSEYVGAEVVMKLGVWPARVSVVPLGCDHVARALPPSVEKAREPYVLTVSRVDPRKNHLRMLEAFELLVREGLPHRWVIAGPPGWNSAPFERALAASPARARVEWRHFVPEEELPLLTEPFFRGEQAVLTHHALGLGLAVAKALAEQDGGSLRVADRDGGGLVVEVRLPAAEAGAA